MSEESAIQALAQLLSLLEPGKIRYRGLLGIAGQSSPAVTGRPNYVWFQEDGNPSKVRQIFNSKVPSVTDLPVIVGQDSNNPGFEQVLDVDIGMLPKWLGRSFIPEHHTTHELGAVDSVGNRVDSDVVYVQKAQFVPLSARAQSTPDMTLFVEADYYLYGTVQRYWSGGSTKSFSAPVTDGYAAYELVCIDGATNQLTYVRGVDFPIAAPRDETLIPDAPIGTLPIVAVYLPHGVSTLTYANMADTRMFQSTLGGSITGMPHRHTSEFDGGMLSSGLSITGGVLFRRGSDDAIMGRWYDEVGELHLSGGLVTTGDVIITGGTLQIRDTTTSFVGDSVVDSDVRIGKITWDKDNISGYGRKVHFSGGPSYDAWNSENSDPLWMARFNRASDFSELHINIGNENIPVIGTDRDLAVFGFTSFDEWYGKVAMTALGGIAVQRINRTGGVTVKGQLVRCSTSYDDAVMLTGSGDIECIGVILDAGVAESDLVWVVISGIADVLFDDNHGPTRGDWAATGAAGYATSQASPAAAPTHFEEIGHVMESVAAGGGGTHVLARCILHFN